MGREFDLVYTRLGLKILLEDLALSEPPRVDIVILRRTTAEWTDEQYALLPDGIRQSKASHILIEHKQTESITLQVFTQRLVYDHLYPQGHKLKAEEVQTFILSARTPRAAVLAELGFKQSEIAGVYRSENPFAQRLTLLVLNELAPTLNNAFVQCFASRKRVREAAFERLLASNPAELSEAFWNYLLGLRQQWAKRGGEMAAKVEVRELTPDMVMETGRRIRQMWLENLTPEERLAGLAPEERLAGLAPEERLAGLGLPAEEMAKLMEQIERYLSQQQAAK